MTFLNSLTIFLSIFDEISTSMIVEFVLVTVVLVLLNAFIIKCIKRALAIVFSLLFTSCLYVAYIFELNTLVFILGLILLIVYATSIFTNLAEFRKYLANKITEKTTKREHINNRKRNIEKLSNKYDFYTVIDKTVKYLSKNKIGAIMTFERKDNLTNFDFSKNGVELNAPVTFEILITIFYPGTRLHDGAVIIKDDTIKYASVFYTPSTKPLNGKYGSRHRAALGVSEVCDAVTVVVSEETGRVSISYNGEIFSFSSDDFLKAFTNFMQDEDVLTSTWKKN